MSIIKTFILNNFKFIVIAAFTLAIFLRPLQHLVNIWQDDADYSHGFFVIPLSIYFIWQKQNSWINESNFPSFIGFIFFIISLSLFLTSFLVNFYTLAYLSMLAVILGLVLTFAGWKKTRFFVGAILFLIFMFPIPSSVYILITNPLKLFITSLSAYIIHLWGIPVLQEGNLLYFANTSLEVAEACSGLRSFFSYLMLGLVFSVFASRLLSKIILVISSIPLSLIVNIFRVTVTGILSHYYGEKAAQGFFHEFTGMIFFLVGLVLMILIYLFLESGFLRQNKP
jgi:exosortase